MGRSIGIGVDCIGLIIMVGVNARVLDPPMDLDKEWTKYGLLPNPASMRKALEAYMRPVQGPRAPADVAFFDYGAKGLPMHLAIMSRFDGRATIIHADAMHMRPGAKKGHVREVTYSAEWPGRIDSFWRYPGLA